MSACDCGGRHPEGANYYVSVVDGRRVGLLAGPYATHPEALALVDATRDIAERVDCRAAFYAFGTVAQAAEYTTPGVLNSYVAEHLRTPPAPRSPDAP